MGITYNQYRYSIELKYMYNKEQVVIDAPHIHYITIDSRYSDRYSPSMIIKAAIDRNHIDSLIKGSGKETITVTISKFVLGANPIIKQNYINKPLLYFLDESMNENKELDYSENRNRADIFKIIKIGLVDHEALNSNKKLINTVVYDSSVQDLLGYYLSMDRNMLMEKPPYKRISKRIISPLNTVVQLAEFVDDLYGIYDTDFRIFFDYDRNYLLSMSGKPVPSKYENMSVVIFNIKEQVKEQSLLQGLGIDSEQKAYIIEVDTNDTFTNLEKSATQIVNDIRMVDNLGRSSASTAINESGSPLKKAILVKRKPIGNISHRAEVQKNILETGSVNVQITKTDLDASVFTMNKQYIINNYDKANTNKRANFILTRKREIFLRSDDTFVLSSVLSFKKVF